MRMLVKRDSGMYAQWNKPAVESLMGHCLLTRQRPPAILESFLQRSTRIYASRGHYDILREVQPRLGSMIHEGMTCCERVVSSRA